MVCLKVGANLFDGDKSGIIVFGTMAHGEELVMDVGMDIVLK